MQAQIVLTNCPDAEVAKKIAHHLVRSHLAACVNILAPCQSVYQWQGQLCEETEVPLLIKTTAAAYPALEAAIRQLHPYELPEIVAFDLKQGLPAYLDWLAEQTFCPPASY